MIRGVWCLFMVLSMPTVFAAGLEKWTDEEGQVNYGDRVPPKYLGQERETLNPQGVVIKRHSRMMTEEEKEQLKVKQSQEAASKRAKMIEARKRALRDRVLLDSFTTERDLIIQRDARVEAVNSQIQLTESIIKDHENKLESIKKRITDIEKSKRKVPENLRKELTSVGLQLETHYQFVQDKSIERNEIIKKFDIDIERFRELQKYKKKRSNSSN